MAWRMKMEPWRGCRPVVAHSHYPDEEHDPDPHVSEKSDSDPPFCEKRDPGPH